MATSGTTTTETAANFRAKFQDASRRTNSLLCVGLDPDPTKIPTGVSTRAFLFGVVDATRDVAACYKPNIAFFEPDLGEGITLLRDLIAYAGTETPVLLDAKRGDIGHTAEAYARAIFDSLGADAVTLNPYLGHDSLAPFLARAERHSFLLCRTSNAGAGDLQDLQVEWQVEGQVAGQVAGHPLYERVAYLANEWNEHGNVGLVVGATYPAEARRIREICPDLLFLMPGVGAQEGAVEEAVRAAVDAEGAGIMVNASRAVLYASPVGDPGCAPGGWMDASREAAIDLRDQINQARAR
ncbi:MAG: orotidine-5'-phosphate decarboxylase [Dehalococcoidia bacterium]|nr:orotidine-5'-phosphate decarboxylase [Dehalococcoidia bacterium]